MGRGVAVVHAFRNEVIIIRLINMYHLKWKRSSVVQNGIAKTDEFEEACCIHGHHIFREIWEAVLGEEMLSCDRESTNERDRYAVTVKKAGAIVGPLFQD